MGLTPRITRVDPGTQSLRVTIVSGIPLSWQLLEETWEDSQSPFLVWGTCSSSRFDGETGRHPKLRVDSANPCSGVQIPDLLETIRQEWELYRLEIRAGRAATLTSAAETRTIHVRPHGRDSTDVDVAPIVGDVVKKSFWLNKNLVSEVLRAVSANEASGAP